MKSKILLRLFFLSMIITSADAHEIAVHSRISEAAATGSAGLENYMTDNRIAVDHSFIADLRINDPIVDFTLANGSPRSLIMYGSEQEDNVAMDSGIYRSFNHFYRIVT